MKDGPSTITEMKVSVIKPGLLLQSELGWLNSKKRFSYQSLAHYITLPSEIYSCSEEDPPMINTDICVWFPVVVILATYT